MMQPLRPHKHLPKASLARKATTPHTLHRPLVDSPLEGEAHEHHRRQRPQSIPCTVIEVIEGPVVSEVDVRLPSGQLITSVITTRSVKDLGLAPGREVVALVKRQKSPSPPSERSERRTEPRMAYHLPRLLIIPGLNDSGPAHWQSWLQRQHRDARRVVQRDFSTPTWPAGPSASTAPSSLPVRGPGWPWPTALACWRWRATSLTTVATPCSRPCWWHRPTQTALAGRAAAPGPPAHHDPADRQHQ